MLLVFSLLPLLSGCDNEDDVIENIHREDMEAQPTHQ